VVENIVSAIMSFTWVCWLDANAFIVANLAMQKGKTLTKSEDFFGPKQAVCYYEPENKSRTLYFFDIQWKVKGSMT
jgi:hypothetical protein